MTGAAIQPEEDAVGGFGVVEAGAAGEERGEIEAQEGADAEFEEVPAGGALAVSGWFWHSEIV